MRFAKIVFWIAGIYGLLVMVPLYFLYDRIGLADPPAITHPQFYYGFVGLGIAWQIAFLVIATDPVRFRPMMVPCMVEKITYVVAVAVLYPHGRISPAQASTAIPDAVLFLLFIISFLKTRAGARRVWIPNVRIP